MCGWPLHRLTWPSIPASPSRQPQKGCGLLAFTLSSSGWRNELNILNDFCVCMCVCMHAVSAAEWILGQAQNNCQGRAGAALCPAKGRGRQHEGQLCYRLTNWCRRVSCGQCRNPGGGNSPLLPLLPSAAQPKEVGEQGRKGGMGQHGGHLDKECWKVITC